jgi:hypothetical protein
VFTTAIGRLELSAGLDSCLLITEEHKHIVRAQQLGMSTLQPVHNEEPDHRHRHMLRPRRERPSCRAPKTSDELPPSHPLL